MNTGLLRSAVATAPTVYGIETFGSRKFRHQILVLQQHLPFTVLKLEGGDKRLVSLNCCNSTYRLRY